MAGMKHPALIRARLPTVYTYLEAKGARCHSTSATAPARGRWPKRGDALHVGAGHEHKMEPASISRSSPSSAPSSPGYSCSLNRPSRLQSPLFCPTTAATCQASTSILWLGCSIGTAPPHLVPFPRSLPFWPVTGIFAGRRPLTQTQTQPPQGQRLQKLGSSRSPSGSILLAMFEMVATSRQ